MSRLGSLSSIGLNGIGGVIEPINISEKVSGTVISASGSNFSLDSSIKKFGTTSLKCLGQAIPFQFNGISTALGAYNGSLGWTFEFWSYIPSTSNTTGYFWQVSNASGTNSVQFWYDYSTTEKFVLIINGSGIVPVTALNTDTWNHIVVTLVGVNVYIWINGTRVYNSTSSSNYNISQSQITVYPYTVIYMDDLRVSSGSIYGTGTTLTVPSNKLTVDASTLALIGT
jgi:hypothetical protein